ncbi:BMP family protein [Rummeliibacillus sp. SL167]|uniref:BMP family lipoprotein n=1 Tax=Rummeliibacillus sp. SL167 TaxID=2579792 RepID=UPI0011B3F29B|nr:BMP family ABC transporter substrate-binding protein [Rummeliibacillus sp. SL167]
MGRRCLLLILIGILLSSGCGRGQESQIDHVKDKMKIGIMLSDVGLGDQSFSDSAFKGLVRARDELGILFDYREIKDTKTYEKGLTELVKQGNDVIVGLGFMVQEDLEKVAKKYPKQQFVLIDAVSNLQNVSSITFKADQGSYLAGVVAALTTKSNVLGFIGGDDVPTIQQFSEGFQKGAKVVKPNITIIEKYAGNFGDDKLGSQITKQMIAQKADVIYAAAGFTGVGMLKEAQKEKVLAIGVDTDQYFYAEKAVVTSMLKHVDVALFEIAAQLTKKGVVTKKQQELGIDENGVGLAPIRVVSLTKEQEDRLKKEKEKLTNGNY